MDLLYNSFLNEWLKQKLRLVLTMYKKKSPISQTQFLNTLASMQCMLPGMQNFVIYIAKEIN